MKAVDSVFAEGGVGLVGDRYHGSRHRHVTVQSLTQLAVASEALGTQIHASDTRRNITILDGDIPATPGDRIRLGAVDLEVVRIAAPCKLLDDVIGRGAKIALRRQAGSVCRLLTSGELHVGDAVDLRPPTLATD